MRSALLGVVSQDMCFPSGQKVDISFSLRPHIAADFWCMIVLARALNDLWIAILETPV